MASDISGFFFTGRLVSAMEMRYTQAGYPIGNFTLAVNRAEKQKDGQWTEIPSFFDCTVFGSAAQNLARYLVKGKQVSVSGYPKQDRWEKDGQRFSRVKFVVEHIQLVGRGKTAEEPPQQGADFPPPQTQSEAGDGWEQQPYPADSFDIY